MTAAPLRLVSVVPREAQERAVQTGTSISGYVRMLQHTTYSPSAWIRIATSICTLTDKFEE